MSTSLSQIDEIELVEDVFSLDMNHKVMVLQAQVPIDPALDFNLLLLLLQSFSLIV
jgi:hypothetical protein